jgi:hypothetical protein
VVLARPEDKRLGDPGGLFDVDAPESWVELGAADLVRAAASSDADTIAIIQALRAVDLANGADAVAVLVRGAAAAVDQGAAGQGAAGALTAAAAERAVRALQAILGRVAPAA